MILIRASPPSLAVFRVWSGRSTSPIRAVKWGCLIAFLAITGARRVIDLGQGLFDQFFKVMTEIGFEDEARQKLIQPIVLFIADSAPFTATTYADLRGRLRQTIFVPVHNEAASFMVIARDFPPSSPKYETIRIPRLSPIVRGVIDRPGFSFGAYMSQQSGGPTEVHSWIGQVFAEFRELELKLLIGELESSLRGGGKQQVRKTVDRAGAQQPE